jgi:hypothetical protein
MSLDQHNNALYGEIKPQFPDELEDLNFAYAIGHMLTGEDIKVALSQTELQFEYESFVATSDGYQWFGRLQIDIEDRSFSIFFPFAHDIDGMDGVKIDRSIAVYSDGSVSPEIIAQVIAQLSERFKFA